jgi:hypothetical protein
VSEPRTCARPGCGQAVPAQMRGRRADYCSAACGFRVRNARRPVASCCPECPHCQEQSALRAAEAERGVQELREGRARLLAQFIGFRAQVEQLAEEWGLPRGARP